jgi:WD repeat-containing protein 89
MKTVQPLSSTDLSLPSESYIYKLQPISNHLACISSDDSVRIFDATTLKLLPDGVLKNVHESVTCLKRYGEQQLVTAGRDGACRWWDSRTGSVVLELKTRMAAHFPIFDNLLIVPSKERGAVGPRV